MLKHCTRCGFTKPAYEFGFDRQSSDRLTSYCLVCKSTLNREYYQRNKERLNERDKARYQASKTGQHSKGSADHERKQKPAKPWTGPLNSWPFAASEK
ncbi:hypothetical protein R75461_05280 [Paraburkholderia nemoris]|nr:hypothetical protein R75461_05280 [Paraburkholderia nemoris]